MKGLVELVQHHARAVYLLFILTAVAGYLAFQHLPSAVYPELSFPRIAVIASAGDTSPERVLVSVTRILEEAASQVYGVKWVRSKTIRGATELSVEFQHGTDLVFALHQLQGRISEIQSKLPPNVGLTIELVTPAIFPVISYNVTTETLTQADLYSICRYQVAPALSRVPGVARARIQGGDIPEVAVQVDPAKLKSYGLSVSQVADAVKKTIPVLVVGRVDEAHQQNLIVTSDQSLTPSQISNLVVATRNNNPIYLKDVARVSDGFADRLSYVHVEEKPAAAISIFRQPTSNVVVVSKGVKDELDDLKSSLPLGVNIEPAYDESGLVTRAMNNVRDAILIGIGLIIVVLFLFLRSWQATLIALLTIPLSALAAFGVLYLLHQNLNLMSLGGLAVAIGLVIDDAIVVIENIHRHLKLTAHPAQAVVNAVVELGGPVTSSTATTVVVFLPLGLLSGVAGQFFTSLTITLASAVIFSLLLAFTLTPLLSLHLLKRKKSEEGANERSLLGSIYAFILRFTLKQPIWVALAAAGFLSAGVFLYFKLATDFLPAVDEGSYVLDFFAQPGASLAETNAAALKLEEILKHTDEVQTWTRRTGAELGLFATEVSRGDILVVLKPSDERKRSIEEVMEEQRQQIAKEIPQLEVDFHQILQDQLNDLAGAPTPVEVRIFGEDPEVLRKYASEVEEKIRAIKGVVDLKTTSRQGAPEVRLDIDPLKSGRLGLAPADVAGQVQDSLLGRVATQIRRGDRLIDVRVRLNDQNRLNPQFVPQIPIIGLSNEMLPLSDLSDIAKKAGEREIYCENQLRYVSVEGSLEGRDLGSATAEIKKAISTIKLPPGYQTSIAGLYASQQETFSELLLVFSLASLLVYLLLVIQFRSFLQPLAIFIAVPLALFGVEAALLITHTPLNVSSFMGIILLVGLVVKNGIILLEYTNRLRAAGTPIDEALVQAGSIRLRPILMTTLCTLLGLFPLAIGFGAGAELQKPLAIAVIGGLSLSTIFTLIFVPVIFRFLCRAAKTSAAPQPTEAVQ